ncbi:DNA adenine methylase [Acidimicrobiia bacterium]|jgi:adenine-specific DNA-methyltransferase|nr:DNA adenine methylase [Acidimicrobiia bacterium]
MRYYGGKSKLLDLISEGVSETNLTSDSIFLDAFSGTSVVGEYFKKKDFTVYSNDTLHHCFTLAKGLIEINNEPKFRKFDEDIFFILNSLKGITGFLTKHYSPYKNNERQYFSVDNAMKIDAINFKIHEYLTNGLISSREFYYLKTSLLKAINLVSNVSGTYGAYLKSWDTRALNDLKLEHPNLYDNKKKNKAFNEDINNLATRIKVDIAYLDPPYNSRQYHSNYFIPELLSRGWFDKKYEPKGVTGMVDFSNLKSQYSSKKFAYKQLEDLIVNLNCKYILLSYNNEGIVDSDKIKKLLSGKGDLKIINKEHKRYRSINQDGSNIKTKEFLYVVKVD